MVEPSTSRKKSRFWLYAPFVLLLILVGAWTAYWFIAKGQLDKGIDEWIAAERANGAELEYSSKSLGGFPYRFELVVNDPIYQPAGAPRWEGEQLRLVMQPWNWQHVIAYSPGRNLLTEAGGLRQTVTLDKTSAASLSWNSDTEFLGDTIGPSRLIGEVRSFFPAWIRSGGNPERFHRALVQEDGAVEIAQGLLDWGPLDLGVKGDIKFDDGLAHGSLGMRIESADELRDALDASGQLGQQENAMLTMLETSSADGGFLTFTIKDSEVRMGLIPVGTLPEPGY